MTTIRSARLVAWVRAWRAGFISVDDALAAIHEGAARHEGPNRPGGPNQRNKREGPDNHLVTDLPSGREPQPLSTLLPALAKVSPDDIRLVLPAPGDPRGLPGPGPFTTACLLSGEGIRCRSWGLIPELMTHRSGSGDIWHTVEWRYFVLPVPGPPTESLTLAEADHDLLAAVRGATETLRRLEVARWRPELGPALHGLRDPSGDADLPPGYPPRAAQVLRRAEAVTAIAELATTDAPGSAVTAAEAAGRDEALRPLATAARRAACAAYNAPLEC